MYPLPFTCQHEHYIAGAVDDHGNTVPTWANPVAVPCFWWSGTTVEPLGTPSGSDQVSVDVTVVVDAELVVDHRDRFTIDGKPFEVLGLPKDFDHGPFGFTPNRRPIELKWVG